MSAKKTQSRARRQMQARGLSEHFELLEHLSTVGNREMLNERSRGDLNSKCHTGRSCPP